MTEMVAMALLSATATFIGLHFGRRWERERCARIAERVARIETRSPDGVVVALANRADDAPPLLAELADHIRGGSHD